MNGCHIDGTPLVVDFWREREVPPRCLFFLTHMHADHTSGLSWLWKHPIHCTAVTAKLLVKKFKIRPQFIVELDVGHSCILHVNCPGERVSVTVTTLEANHCPGAAMFLFEGYFGSILYTGDFRFCPSMLSNPFLNGSRKVDLLYLDNTYCDPSCVFPSREEATESIISLIEHHQSSASKDKDVATVIGLNTLGKEDLLVTIACRLKQWVGVSKERYESLKLLELPDVFCTDSSECHVQVHRAYLVSRGMMSRCTSEEHVMAILPTSLYTGRGAPSPPMDPLIKVVPYSDHSSFSELQAFVGSVKPRQIRPIVKNFTGQRSTIAATRRNMAVFEELLDPTPPDLVTVPEGIQKLLSVQLHRESLTRSNSFPSTSDSMRALSSKSSRLVRKRPKGVQYLSPTKYEPKRVKLDDETGLRSNKTISPLGLATESTENVSNGRENRNGISEHGSMGNGDPGIGNESSDEPLMNCNSNNGDVACNSSAELFSSQASSHCQLVEGPMDAFPSAPEKESDDFDHVAVKRRMFSSVKPAAGLQTSSVRNEPSRLVNQESETTPLSGPGCQTKPGSGHTNQTTTATAALSGPDCLTKPGSGRTNQTTTATAALSGPDCLTMPGSGRTNQTTTATAALSGSDCLTKPGSGHTNQTITATHLAEISQTTDQLECQALGVKTESGSDASCSEESTDAPPFGMATIKLCPNAARSSARTRPYTKHQKPKKKKTTPIIKDVKSTLRNTQSTAAAVARSESPTGPQLTVFSGLTNSTSLVKAEFMESHYGGGGRHQQQTDSSGSAGETSRSKERIGAGNNFKKVVYTDKQTNKQSNQQLGKQNDKASVSPPEVPPANSPSLKLKTQSISTTAQRSSPKPVGTSNSTHEVRLNSKVKVEVGTGSVCDVPPANKKVKLEPPNDEVLFVYNPTKTTNSGRRSKVKSYSSRSDAGGHRVSTAVANTSDSGAPSDGLQQSEALTRKGGMERSPPVKEKLGGRNRFEKLVKQEPQTPEKQLSPLKGQGEAPTNHRILTSSRRNKSRLSRTKWRRPLSTASSTETANTAIVPTTSLVVTQKEHSENPLQNPVSSKPPRSIADTGIVPTSSLVTQKEHSENPLQNPVSSKPPRSTPIHVTGSKSKTVATIEVVSNTLQQPEIGKATLSDARTPEPRNNGNGPTPTTVQHAQMDDTFFSGESSSEARKNGNELTKCTTEVSPNTVQEPPIDDASVSDRSSSSDPKTIKEVDTALQSERSDSHGSCGCGGHTVCVLGLSGFFNFSALPARSTDPGSASKTPTSASEASKTCTLTFNATTLSSDAANTSTSKATNRTHNSLPVPLSPRSSRQSSSSASEATNRTPSMPPSARSSRPSSSTTSTNSTSRSSSALREKPVMELHQPPPAASSSSYFSMLTPSRPRLPSPSSSRSSVSPSRPRLASPSSSLASPSRSRLASPLLSSLASTSRSRLASPSRSRLASPSRSRLASPLLSSLASPSRSRSSSSSSLPTISSARLLSPARSRSLASPTSSCSDSASSNNSSSHGSSSSSSSSSSNSNSSSHGSSSSSSSSSSSHGSSGRGKGRRKS